MHNKKYTTLLFEKKKKSKTAYVDPNNVYMRLITTTKILHFFSCVMECKTKNSVNNT